MKTSKQFLLSIFATTLSIALTFGTAAIIDHRKEKNEKREIVMMVMYDMYTSMKSMETADSVIRQKMDIQQRIAEDTSLFESIRFQMMSQIPTIDYTETTERIFSSSIETINTVGNVLFTEIVAEFYQNRQLYKTMVCDSLTNEMAFKKPFSSVKATLDLDYSLYAIVSCGMKKTMQHLYAQCKQMMKVSDEEIVAYRRERERMERGVSEGDEPVDSIILEIMKQQSNIEESKAKLGLK